VLAEGNINFEFDSETQEYYITWEPVVIGLGKTRQEAMEDLRTAAQFYIDTIIDIKLEDTGIRKEN
jgi:predicted RNase H-like HicB family nuclease